MSAQRFATDFPRLGRHPVIGQLRTNPLVSLYPEIDAGYDEYETPTMQGLAKAGGGCLELLVINAHVPDIGDGGRFLAECMHEYATVIVWAVGSAVLEGMLVRRGFREVSDDDGETGWRWDAEVPS